MSFFSLEHSRTGYVLDFALYGVVIVALSALLLATSPPGRGWQGAGLVLLGLASWSPVEYLIHRFVLHGWPPFRGWHEQHHARPTALISSPTVLSASLIAVLVFLPAWFLAGAWLAAAGTLGMLTGYLAYAVVHHATHHWRADAAWLKQRKRWHGLHHHHAERPCCYGVTSGFWDRLFGTLPAPAGRSGNV